MLLMKHKSAGIHWPHPHSYLSNQNFLRVIFVLKCRQNSKEFYVLRVTCTSLASSQNTYTLVQCKDNVKYIIVLNICSTLYQLIIIIFFTSIWFNAHILLSCIHSSHTGIFVLLRFVFLFFSFHWTHYTAFNHRVLEHIFFFFIVSNFYLSISF